VFHLNQSTAELLYHTEMKPDKVSIIIPALNEEATIETVVRGLLTHFPEAEIIVIDDGSSDATGKLAAQAGAQVISHDHNLGYGASLRTGVEAASRDFVLFCDADGQHTAEDVGRLMEACDDVDMVIGARNQDSHVPFIRRPGKFILRWFANYLAGERITDLNSGLRIMRKSVLKKYLHLMPRGFSFSTTSTFAFLKTYHRILYIPITVHKRSGKSSVRQWKHGPQTLMLMLRLTVLFEPLKVFLTTAGILFAMTLFTFVFNTLESGTYKIGPTTILLGIATLLVFMFGLLCDQVSALRREIHE